jgi:hypothetical protein
MTSSFCRSSTRTAGAAAWATLSKEGLNIFHHYKTEFESFNKILVTKSDPNIEAIVETMKVSHFVKDRLKPQDFTRFFPVPVP